jgi:hypothetical protein
LKPILKITDEDGNHHYGWHDRLYDGAPLELVIQKMHHHRRDGPAIEYVDGFGSWYINNAAYNYGPSFYRVAALSEDEITILKLKYG